MFADRLFHIDVASVFQDPLGQGEMKLGGSRNQDDVRTFLVNHFIQVGVQRGHSQLRPQLGQPIPIDVAQGAQIHARMGLVGPRLGRAPVTAAKQTNLIHIFHGTNLIDWNVGGKGCCRTAAQTLQSETVPRRNKEIILSSEPCTCTAQDPPPQMGCFRYCRSQLGRLQDG